MNNARRLLSVAFIFLFVVAVVNSVIQGNKYYHNETPTVSIDKSSDLYKTVAHIDMSDVEDLVLVYEDAENDVAYYRYVGDRDIIKEGDTVTTYEGNSAKVIALDVQGFYLEYSDMFYKGMSGTSIFDSNGNVVGYVSKIVNNERVFCIWK